MLHFVVISICKQRLLMRASPVCIACQHLVGWEPEGRYRCSTMFAWKIEGRYRHRLCTAIAPFWFSTGTLLNSDCTLLVLNGTLLNSDSALLVLNGTLMNSDCALLVLNWTSLNSVNNLLALNWRSKSCANKLAFEITILATLLFVHSQVPTYFCIKAVCLWTLYLHYGQR